MKSKTYNGEVRSSEKEFETLQLGAFVTPGLLPAQGTVGLTAEFGLTRELGGTIRFTVESLSRKQGYRPELTTLSRPERMRAE
jgi:hypothetical protein